MNLTTASDVKSRHFRTMVIGALFACVAPFAIASAGASTLRPPALVAKNAAQLVTAHLPKNQCSTAFYEGNKLLGPTKVAHVGKAGAELSGYKRTGGLSVRNFLAKYYSHSANAGQGGWIYPPASGYVVGPKGEQEESHMTLYVGQDLDRFGSEYGAFLSPAGLPYAARSIPPQNLDGTPPGGCNYHEYRVTKDFVVDAGPIAPWFGQPGGGIQFQLDPTLIMDSPTPINVMWLVKSGYLTPIS